MQVNFSCQTAVSASRGVTGPVKNKVYSSTALLKRPSEVLSRLRRTAYEYETKRLKSRPMERWQDDTDIAHCVREPIKELVNMCCRNSVRRTMQRSRASCEKWACIRGCHLHAACRRRCPRLHCFTSTTTTTSYSRTSPRCPSNPVLVASLPHTHACMFPLHYLCRTMPALFTAEFLSALIACGRY